MVRFFQLTIRSASGRELLRAAQPRVDSDVLCAAIVGYPVSGFAWSLAYALLGRLDPTERKHT